MGHQRPDTGLFTLLSEAPPQHLGSLKVKRGKFQMRYGHLVAGCGEAVVQFGQRPLFVISDVVFHRAAFKTR